MHPISLVGDDDSADVDGSKTFPIEAPLRISQRRQYKFFHLLMSMLCLFLALINLLPLRVAPSQSSSSFVTIAVSIPPWGREVGQIVTGRRPSP